MFKIWRKAATSNPALEILKNLSEVSDFCPSFYLSSWQQQVLSLIFPAPLGILFLRRSHKHVLFLFTWSLSPSISYSILLYLRGCLLSFQLPGPSRQCKCALTHKNKHKFQLKLGSTWWMWLPFNFNYRRSLASWKAAVCSGNIRQVMAPLQPSECNSECVCVCVYAYCYIAEYTVQQIHVDKAQP